MPVYTLEPRYGSISRSVEKKLWRCAKDVLIKEKEMRLNYKQQLTDEKYVVDFHKKRVTLRKPAT